MTFEKDINESVCDNCHITILEPHPTLVKWLKCSVCGFCKENKKEAKIGDWRMVNKENEEEKTQIGSIPIKDYGRKI